MSVDHVPCLTAWAESLGGISFPLLSDFWPHGHAAKLYGVFREPDGHSERAIFVIGPDGRIQYIDVHDIDDQPDNEVLFAELAKAAGVEPPPPPEALAQPDGALLMYCRPGCPDCRRARMWLEAEGIAYVEIDVTADAEARERAAGFNDGKLHTPTFELAGSGEVCVDFRPERLDEMLGRG